MRQPKVDLWGARVRYQTELSELYHTARATQLARMKHAFQFLTVASGAPALILLAQKSVAAAQYLAWDWIVAALSAIMAIFAALDLILRISDRATEHRVLALQFSELAKELRSKTLTLEDLERIQDRIDSITLTEPGTTNILLEARCHNKLMRAYSFGEEYSIRTGFFWRTWRRFTTEIPLGLAPRKNLEMDEKYYIERMGAPVVRA
jgi:hypothetical protein